MSGIFLNGKVTLMRGDCLERLRELKENSIDSCVTDPPYHLTSIVKRFGAENAAPAKAGKTGAYARASKGFMGKQWDGGDIAFRPELWAEVLRVLKPGAHLLAFSGTRTYHRMVCAIEDAGFEIRDQLAWTYGMGFPKSHDVSKGIDRILGVEHEREITHYKGQGTRSMFDGGKPRPASLPASLWQGWGTALKPAWEPIVLARKPLSESSIAANVLRHGVGGINIDGCRIGLVGGTPKPPSQDKSSTTSVGGYLNSQAGELNGKGRWPANLIHDGSEEVVRGFPDSVARPVSPENIGKSGSGEPRGMFGSGSVVQIGYYDSETSAARFFYTAKADSDDRLGSKHPTVKPLDLMQYLVRLITPPKGLCLDPFAGTGTTAEAAFREGMRCILIEREPEYQADIERRMALVLAGPNERVRKTIKARGLEADAGPLFGGGAVMRNRVGAPLPQGSKARSGRRIYGVFADEKNP